MHYKPVADYKARRQGLDLATRIRVDELLSLLKPIFGVIRELQIPNQRFEFHLNSGMIFRVTLVSKTGAVYLMLYEKSTSA